MNPSSIRDASWLDVQRWVSRARREVYELWRVYGPGSTKALSEKTNKSILTLRPRTTELCQVGLVECVGKDPANPHDGIYRAVPEDRAREIWEAARAATRSQQLTLL